MPLGKGVAKRLDQNAKNYLILDGLLFKILDDGKGNLDSVVYSYIKSAHFVECIGRTHSITKCYHTRSQRFCHDLKEILWVTNFFIIIVKHDNYYSGSGAQVLLLIDFKLH